MTPRRRDFTTHALARTNMRGTSSSRSFTKLARRFALGAIAALALLSGALAQEGVPVPAEPININGMPAEVVEPMPVDPMPETIAPAPAPEMADAPSAGMIERTVVDVALEDARFATLVAALTATPDLLEQLETAGPWTVFAPTSDAIMTFLNENGLTAEELLASPGLGDVLRKHIVAGSLLATDAVAAVSAGPIAVSTLNGDIDARLVEGILYVGGAAVVQTDILADNGVVHVIDRVIQ